MSTPYVAHGNLFFVPIIRLRLNFAVLVRRAVDELALGYEDLLAVELPESARESVEAAIQQLPTVSLLVASITGSEQREVFPITPADGIVEAIRIAGEAGVGLRYIDQDVAPANLLDRNCIAVPGWPDDSLALEQGAEWYLKLIQKHLSHPPARLEPVDTWRESYMAEQLRQLYPFYRRIVVVCDASHVNRIRRLVAEPTRLTHQGEGKMRPPIYQIRKPSLPVLLRYLDDVPKVVELYEQARAAGNGSGFDKASAVLDATHQLREQASDIQFSTRHYQAFAQLLANMTAQEQRLAPTLDSVYGAAVGCFSPAFAERFRIHLLSYFDQVGVERVAAPNERPNEFRPNDDDHSGTFVGRSCTPIQQQHDIRPINIGPHEARPRPKDQAETQDKEEEEDSLVWPPYKRFLKNMRHKTFALTRERSSVKSREFRGSIEAGIDSRRTLRSHWSGRPRVFVRQRYRPKVRDADTKTPIVWLLDSELKQQPKGRFATVYFGPIRDRPRLSAWSFYVDDLIVYGTKDDDFRVRHETPLGIVSFCDAGTTIDDIQATFGREFEFRVPLEEAFPRHEKLGRLPSELAARARAGSSWWQILLLGALRYAEDEVICVSPARFSIPREIMSLAAEEDKSFRQIPFGRFSQEERIGFGAWYYLLGVHPFLDRRRDINSSDVQALIVEHYSSVMKRFWD